jgi:1,4-alpha-glucan branching enzyme
MLACVCNLSPVPRPGYRVGLPRAGRWREALNTDSAYYGGSGVGNLGGVTAEAMPWHDQPFSAPLTLPPLAAVWLVPE